ncbi:hypothetical protein HLH26_06805 [Gluconacetobacter sp. 1b LMG 1731]|uniref:Uncharacterized protein n=1 Tax=Gluconacetobacter dulcium TaxID=2729096 RepID=A0A7W4IJY8_9PROT|nr:hypothetical protein [Gluconacetobacter dulcium]MBB2164255.1 hypothetical protein [Gluconacetobacter dulcium]MBB2193337.1 hypothetical protein [Gluconacetobacter dulcium]
MFLVLDAVVRRATEWCALLGELERETIDTTTLRLMYHRMKDLGIQNLGPKLTKEGESGQPQTSFNSRRLSRRSTICTMGAHKKTSKRMLNDSGMLRAGLTARCR